MERPAHDARAMSNSTETGLGPTIDVVIVGEFTFPDRSASAFRVLGLGRALREAGMKVGFVGVESLGRPEDRQADGGYAFDGFPYYPEQRPDREVFRRARRAVSTHVLGNTFLARLRAIDTSRVRVIIAYHPSTPTFLRLRRFCRQRQIVLIPDCTEWYSPRQVAGGWCSPLLLDSELRMRWANVSTGSVIVISSFLDDYYTARECRTLRVPPLVDLQEPKWRLAPQRTASSELRLVYAGVPGKKDQLQSVLLAIRAIKREKVPISLTLIGPSREILVNVCLSGDSSLLDELHDCVTAVGPLPHVAALRRVSEADFSVLLRPDARYAKAGFPTKVVESLAASVPVVATSRGDIGLYVRDGVEGFLLSDNQPSTLAAMLRRIAAAPREQWRRMREDAHTRAEECFDYRRHVEPLRGFLDEAIAHSRAGR